MGQDGGEWKTFVTSKGPELAAASCNGRDGRSDKRDNDDSSHNARARIRVRGVEENLDQRRVGSVWRIESRSPRVKQKVTSMINPVEPLTTIDHMIDRGRTTPASFVSSAIV